MNAKNLLLGIFVILTLAFGSLALAEYYQVNTLSSQLSQSKSASQTTTTTVSSTAACPPDTPCASFTYTPTGQVQVKSVQANESQAQNGEQLVTFYVTFENIGNSPIYFESSALGSFIATNSSALREIIPAQVPPGASISVTLIHGQNYTLVAPYSGDDYYYQLVQAGSVDVSFSFSWITDQQFLIGHESSTSISAQFTFA